MTITHPVRSVDLGFEHVWLPGSDSGTLLLLHATGGDEYQLLDLGCRLAPGATLLSPRGNVLEDGRVRRFFRRHGLFDPDIADLRARTADLADFVAAAGTAYAFDRDQVLAVGYSNGANIALNLLLERPETLTGAVLLRPALQHVPKRLPRLDGKPVLVLGGAFDPSIPRALHERLVSTLRAADAAVTAFLAPAGHELSQEDVRRASSWIAAYAPTDSAIEERRRGQSRRL